MPIMQVSFKNQSTKEMELYEMIIKDAEEESTNLSGWMKDAARMKLGLKKQKTENTNDSNYSDLIF